MSQSLVDASALISLFDRADVAHKHYRALIAGHGAAHQLHSTWPCVAEASHMLGLIDRVEMLLWVGHGGLQIFPFEQTALLDMAPWMQAYSEPRRTVMDLADASLYWLANETGVTRIMTLDVRDFSRYRLPNGRAFELL